MFFILCSASEELIQLSSSYGGLKIAEYSGFEMKTKTLWLEWWKKTHATACLVDVSPDIAESCRTRDMHEVGYRQLFRRLKYSTYTVGIYLCNSGCHSGHSGRAFGCLVGVCSN